MPAATATATTPQPTLEVRLMVASVTLLALVVVLITSLQGAG